LRRARSLRLPGRTTLSLWLKPNRANKQQADFKRASISQRKPSNNCQVNQPATFQFFNSLIRGGVQFNQYVGVLQVGGTTIEVLPKVDRLNKEDDSWRKVLIDMLRKVHGLDLKSTNNAALRLKPHSILDLYMELLVTEVAYLMRQGLTKSYRKTEGNRTALKGKLLFAKQIRHNLVHAERFYVQHSTYDRENKFNCILQKALHLVARLCTQASLRAHVAQLLIDFPELPDIAVDEALFQRLPWTRKTEGYRKAIDIARLLLLNFHPDIRGGEENVIALMFDMNQLWERYMMQILRHAAPDGWTVEGQRRALFWEADGLPDANLKPDIVLHGSGCTIILDTKWKLLDGGRPSDADIRQLFAYQHKWKAEEGFLVYPDTSLHVANGRFHASIFRLHVMGVQVIDADGNLNNALGTGIWNEVLFQIKAAKATVDVAFDKTSRI
jgi:5-methylcytosine-specific restriction enzyme subunit McrC